MSWAIPGYVVSSGPAMTPANPDRAAPKAKTPMKTSGTLNPRALTISLSLTAARRMIPRRVL
ncbi:MAG: hypothetical protein A4E73_01547 [Syntrophaceae bacterium PtaU1.Bin231]|nr:MAG: hypothetical protein A4E73_01547 [Syntrophaceae bacterium PtaU1.Bin231]